MKKNITKRAIVFILTLFVFTCISLAEALPPTLQQENINLKESLEEAYYQAESAQQVNVEQKENLIKELYPLFMGSCAEGYIKEQLAQNPNWRIKRIKDNGEFEKIARRSIHSYTIISTSGWKTFKCNDTGSFEYYIDLNKNPKDYQIYLALLKARRKLSSAMRNYIQKHSNGHYDVRGREDFQLAVRNCEYDLRYFAINDAIPEDIKKRTYNNSALVSYYPYTECLEDCELLHEGTYHYRYKDESYTGPWYPYIGLSYPTFQCNTRSVRVCFVRYERKLFSGKTVPEETFGWPPPPIAKELNPKDIHVCIEPEFKPLKVFKVNDYLDPSIGVKCKQIPEEVFLAVEWTHL